MTRQQKTGAQLGGAAGGGVVLGNAMHKALASPVGWWASLLLAAVAAALMALLVFWLIGRWVMITVAEPGATADTGGR